MTPLQDHQQQQVDREREFHNRWADETDLDELLVTQSFESPTAIENAYALEQFGDLQGKTLLDLGCGAGETSVYFALRGAKVTASDIAENFLRVVNRLADRYGVSLNTLAADAGNLPFKDNTYDFVFCNGVLHHVHLESAASEIHRVLKPGGKAICVEPLPYNPVINVYRKMASEVRTKDEKPLSTKQIKSFCSIFKSSRCKEFWLFSLYIFIHFYVFKRWHPSKVRYWKRVLEVGCEFKTLFAVLQKIDHFMLKFLPFLRPLCWNTVIVVTK